jgi:hypothetical protein
MKHFLAIFGLLLSLQSYAGLGEDFRDLKDSGVDYEVIGAVCEQVAKLRYQEEFASNKYEVITGIEYSDGSRTIGELDVVVFEKASQKVVRVSEVKCWKSTDGAIRKAREQRQRFQNFLRSGKPIYFNVLHSSSYRFKRDNFLSTREFTAVAQKGSKAAGFDVELPYELRDLMKLRQMLLECQQSHQCKRPE